MVTVMAIGDSDDNDDFNGDHHDGDGECDRWIYRLIDRQTDRQINR